MKLLGRQIDAGALWEKVEARLQARGLLATPRQPIDLDGPEPFVDPLSFHLTALEANADPTHPLPSSTAPASVLGRLAQATSTVARFVARPVIEELFARQHLFNVHVRDAYAQLSAEVIALKKRLPEAAPAIEKPAVRKGAGRKPASAAAAPKPASKSKRRPERKR